MNFFKEHGTKIIGYITSAIGGLAVLDPATITAVLNAIAGDRGPGLAVVVLGALTTWRGYQNTKNNKTP